MNLAVDYGNSSAKVGIFENDRFLEQFVFEQPADLKLFLENYRADNFIISSVAPDADAVSSWARKVRNKFVLTPDLPLPVVNRYATPKTLGVDRIAGVCGARQLYANDHCLVIDAGTCITYDFVDSDGIYHGGAISPGLRMRFQAVHTFTSRLPLVDIPADAPLIGDTTAKSIQSGVMNGIIAEAQGIIMRYEQQFEGLKVILCGGDGGFFENKLKGSIFAVPELVLSGLNSILNYNVVRK